MTPSRIVRDVRAPRGTGSARHHQGRLQGRCHGYEPGARLFDRLFEPPMIGLGIDDGDERLGIDHH